MIARPLQLVVGALALLLANPGHAAQRRGAERSYEVGLRQLELATSAEHLELALAARKKGLYPQAAWELHACLASPYNAVTSTAMRCRSLMQSRHKEWWPRKASSKPSASAVSSQAKKVRKMRAANLRARLELALDAARAGVVEGAWDDARRVLLDLDEELQLKGDRLRALGLTFPEDLSERVLSEAVDINGRRYLKDAFLEALDADVPIYEARDELLCVRSLRGQEEAQAFHDLASALLPLLEEELACRANRRLNLFLCADRGLYERYLTNTMQQEFEGASGFADSERNTAIVVLDDFLDLGGAQAFALHELTHLYMYRVSPTPMPSWYAEGLAEIHGAQGTFSWDGKTLSIGGRLPAERIRDLLASGERRGLRGMLEEDALEAWDSSDGEGVREYYTEAWALLTFLREEAGRKVALKLIEWEVTCRGDGLIGARGLVPDEAGAVTPDVGPARRHFYELFDQDLPKLEREFTAWLEAYE